MITSLGKRELAAFLFIVLFALVADLILYSHEAEFIQGLMKAGRKRLAQQFHFTYRYINDAFYLNNSTLSECLGFIFPRELEIKETSET